MVGDDIVEQPVRLVLQVLDLPAVPGGEGGAVEAQPVRDLELPVEEPDQGHEKREAEDRLQEEGLLVITGEERETGQRVGRGRTHQGAAGKKMESNL